MGETEEPWITLIFKKNLNDQNNGSAIKEMGKAVAANLRI